MVHWRNASSNSSLLFYSNSRSCSNCKWHETSTTARSPEVSCLSSHHSFYVPLLAVGWGLCHSVTSPTFLSILCCLQHHSWTFTCIRQVLFPAVSPSQLWSPSSSAVLFCFYSARLFLFVLCICPVDLNQFTTTLLCVSQ